MSSSTLIRAAWGTRNFIAVGGVSGYERMDCSGAISRNRRGILFAAVILSIAACAQAAEKYWIAHQADLVVVGTFRQGLTYP
jgi:hypothetical protein